MTDEEAFQYGQEAFKRGIACAPILDVEFVESLPRGWNPQRKLLQAWIIGWTATNLQTDIDQGTYPELK